MTTLTGDISSLIQRHCQTKIDEMSPVNVVILFLDPNLGFYEMFVFGLCFVLCLFRLSAGHGYRLIHTNILVNYKTIYLTTKCERKENALRVSKAKRTFRGSNPRMQLEGRSAQFPVSEISKTKIL